MIRSKSSSFASGLVSLAFRRPCAEVLHLILRLTIQPRTPCPSSQFVEAVWRLCGEQLHVMPQCKMVLAHCVQKRLGLALQLGQVVCRSAAHNSSSEDGGGCYVQRLGVAELHQTHVNSPFRLMKQPGQNLSEELVSVTVQLALSVL